MAGIKINQLPSASSLLPSDILLASSGSVTSQVTVANLRGSMISGSNFSLAMFSGSTALTSSGITQDPITGTVTIPNRFQFGIASESNTIYGTSSFSNGFSFNGNLTTIKNIKANGVTIGAFPEDPNTGADNIVFATYSIPKTSYGNYNNTAVGYNAGEGLGFGSNTVAVGAYAAKYSQTSENTAVGAYAFYTSSTGTGNTAIGVESLYSASGVNNNTAVGAYSLHELTTGANNIGIGVNAGSYDRNGNSVTTNTNSVFIGNNSKSYEVGSTNEVVIGHNATGSGSNTVTIGNSDIQSSSIRGTLSVYELKFNTFNTPASSAASGSDGEVRIDENYIYTYETGVGWKRLAISTW
jgi:hypothetical protein